MNRWKAIVSLLCLALWVPATQHCQLEKLPGLSFLQCAGDTEGLPDCQGDSCDVVERGAYKASDSSDVAAVFIAVLLDGASTLVPEPAEAVFPELGSKDEVPLLPERWQSYSVLALPIRGPSLLS